jgi:hypothetical protein
MQVGNGKNTPFWEARWLQGTSPRELAPNLFTVARFKNRSVHRELQNLNWITNLGQISTPEQLEEFTNLFMALSSISLSDENYQITWNWTADGSYSVATTYECQFLGSMVMFPAPALWKSLTEPKCKSFAWLVLHDRVLTVDNNNNNQTF